VHQVIVAVKASSRPNSFNLGDSNLALNISEAWILALLDVIPKGGPTHHWRHHGGDWVGYDTLSLGRSSRQLDRDLSGHHETASKHASGKTSKENCPLRVTLNEASLTTPLCQGKPARGWLSTGEVVSLKPEE